MHCLTTYQAICILSPAMPKDKPSQVRKLFGFRMEESLMRELRHLAVDEGRRMNDLAQEAFRDLLKKYREKRK